MHPLPLPHATAADRGDGGDGGDRGGDGGEGEGGTAAGGGGGDGGGFISFAKQSKPGPRPVPRMVCGQLKEPENMEEYLMLKERALDKWLRKFVVDNGLQAMAAGIDAKSFDGYQFSYPFEMPGCPPAPVPE